MLDVLYTIVQQLHRIYILTVALCYFKFLLFKIAKMCQHFLMYSIYQFNSTPPVGKLKHHGLNIRYYSRSKLTDWTSEGWTLEKMASKVHISASYRSLLYMQSASLKG